MPEKAHECPRLQQPSAGRSDRQPHVWTTGFGAFFAVVQSRKERRVRLRRVDREGAAGRAGSEAEQKQLDAEARGADRRAGE